MARRRSRAAGSGLLVLVALLASPTGGHPVVGDDSPRSAIAPAAGREAPTHRYQVPDAIYGDLLPAVRALDVVQAHGLGLSGAGVRVGVLAPSFRADHVAFATRVVATRDFVDGDDDVGPPDSAATGAGDLGTAVASLVAGDWPEVLRAPGFEAQLVLARVGGDGPSVRADEERWAEGLEWLVGQGVEVVVSAVAFRRFEDFQYVPGDLDGDGPLSTAAADAAAAAGVLVVVPSGDGGPEETSLSAPADGDSVLAVGASSVSGLTAELTGLGPTADGRPVPLLLAPGVALTAAGGAATDARIAVTGTAFAAALVAGAATLYLQTEAGTAPLEVMRLLRESGLGRLDGVGEAQIAPVPQVGSAVLFPEGFAGLPLDDVSPAGRVTSLTPLFRWLLPRARPEAVPLSFDLEVAADSLFQETVLSQEVSEGSEHRFLRPLPPRSELWWRVIATTGRGFRRSTVKRGPIAVPSWVELRVFNDPGGETVDNPRPTFVWDAFDVDPPAGPLLFDVEILSDRAGELIVRGEDLTRGQFTPGLDLPFNEPLRWRVVARALTEGSDTATSAGPFVVTSRSRPPVTILFQNFPNPFPGGGSAATRIWFDLAEEGLVTLTVHDIRGRLVRRLIPGRGCSPVELAAGQYGREGEGESEPCVLLHWDGRDDGGERMSPGVYLLRLKAGGEELVRRMVYWP